MLNLSVTCVYVKQFSEELILAHKCFILKNVSMCRNKRTLVKSVFIIIYNIWTYKCILKCYITTSFDADGR